MAARKSTRKTSKRTVKAARKATKKVSRRSSKTARKSNKKTTRKVRKSARKSTGRKTASRTPAMPPKKTLRQSAASGKPDDKMGLSAVAP